MSTHQLTPIRMATIQKKRNRNNMCWEGCGEIGTHMHCCWEHKIGQPLWKTMKQLLERLKIKLPHDLGHPTWEHRPKELTAGVLAEASVHPCSLQPYSQQPEMWNHPNASVGRGTNEQNVVYMTMNYPHPPKGRTFWHPLQNGWTLRTLCQVKWARHTRTHTVWLCSQEALRVTELTSDGESGTGDCQGHERTRLS